MHRPLVGPRPHLLGDVGQHRGEQPEHDVERDPQRRTGAGGAGIPLGAVGAVLDQLEVVVAERPEPLLGGLEGPGEVPRLEAGGGLGDDVAQPGEQGEVERLGHLRHEVALHVAERQRELAGVEHLDGEPAADLDLAGVVGRVGAEATAGRPVAHGIRAVLLEEVLGGDHVAARLAHLLAVGVEDPPADRRVGPRHRAELEVRAHHGREQPGADDVVPLRAQVEREHLLEQRVGAGARGVAPAAGDLRGERRGGPGVEDVGVADEAAGLAALALGVAGRRVGGGVDGELGLGGHDRAVVDGLAVGVDRVPDRDRHAEEALA